MFWKRSKAKKEIDALKAMLFYNNSAFQGEINCLKEKTQNLLRVIENNYQTNKKEMSEIKENIIIHKKIVNCPETTHLHANMFHGLYSPETEEDYKEERRQGLRKLGYSYVHTKTNGEEVWAKKSKGK